MRKRRSISTSRRTATFSWKVTARGKPQVIEGDWSLTGGILTSAQGNQTGAMVGNFTWQAENRFQFRAPGTTTDDPGLLFTRCGLDALRGNWFWFVVLGIAAAVALGGVALGSVAIASVATAVAIGLLILVGGIAETVGAFWCRGWSGFFLHLLTGVLSVVSRGLASSGPRSVPCSRPHAPRGVLPAGRGESSRSWRH